MCCASHVFVFSLLAVGHGRAGRAASLLLRARLATSAPTFPPIGAQWRPDNEGRAVHGPSVHLSHGGSLEDLSGQPEGPGGHSPVVLSGRQDRRARRQRLRQVDPAAHHGGHRHRVHRRGLGRRGRPCRLPRAGAAARCRQERARERDGGRRPAEGDPRPLQRARRQLLGRDRRRDDQSAGRDRGQGAVGPRLQGRPGHGRAAMPARRRRRDQAVRRRAAARGALPAAARSAGAAPARRADQSSRRRVGALARGPSAQLSGRDPDRHPRPLLPRQRHRLDPRARPRPRHSVRGQLLGLAVAEAQAAGAGGPRGRGAPAHAGARAGMDRGFTEGAAGEIQGALSAL